MHSRDLHVRVKSVLDSLRAEFGDAEFGYRMQGLFAHVLIRLGAVVLEVNAQGHPDIKARMGDHLAVVQVKSALHSGPLSVFQLSNCDLAGIVCSERTKGYLALLDCAEPVSWVVVDSVTSKQFLNRCMPIASLRAAQDEQLSKECTSEFIDMVLSSANRLNTLTFPLLVQRALRGRQV